MKDAKNIQSMMLNNPIGPLILKLAGPTIIAMLITSFYSLVDTFFVSQLGVIESSAVGIVFSIMAIIQATGLLFGQGAANTISPLLGQGDGKKADEVFAVSFFTALLFLSFFGVVSFIFANPFMRFLGATEETISASVSYGRIIVLGSPFLGVCYTMNNIFRSEGRAFLGMIGMASGAILNIFLDALFIFGFGLGLNGAALATVVSQGIGFCLMLSFFIRKKSNMSLSIKNFKPTKKIYKSIFSLGAPSLLRNIGSTVCNIALMNVASFYTASATAAMSIVGRIVHFVLSLCIGFGQGMQPVVGYNWGAGKKDRVKEAYRFSIRLGVAVFIVLAIILALFSSNVMEFFISDVDAVEIGSRYLFFQALVLPLLVSITLSGMLMQCSGHGFEASLMALIRQGIIYIPVLFLLESALGLLGLELTQSISDIICFAITLWMTRRIRKRENF